MADMNFGQYVAALNEFLRDNPEAAAKPVYIGNGYCTSQDYLRVNRKPYLQKLLGRMSKQVKDDVVLLV